MIMEGIEFQLRQPTHEEGGGTHYPLTLDQRITQGDHYRQDEEKLRRQLLEITEVYQSHPTAHTGDTNCPCCSDRECYIIQAYHAYCLSPEPSRWHSSLTSYRSELQSMFDQPIPNMSAIASRASAGLREHLRRDLCHPNPQDNESVARLKNSITVEFQSDRPINEILPIYLQEQRNAITNYDTQAFITALQVTLTPAERIPLYLQFYGLNIYSEVPFSPQVKNFKAKYARMFEQGYGHDVVVGAMKKEAEEIQEQELQGLKRKEGELRLAQSAHLKNKAKKETRDREREAGKEEDVKKVKGCAKKGCEVEIQDVEPVQCALCDWLAGKNGSGRRQVFYCGVEHAEEDFEKHDKEEHSCVMGDHCFYHPLPGPLGETGAGGVCPHCADAERVSYFCSQACYSHNLDSHRNMYHQDQIFEDNSAQLDLFTPADDLEIDTRL